ncbi:Ribose import permease protein RbsC [Neomoorella glycerini]|uniref:Ribose import permease protein RbsC n=1 Tax=Neomoorella glycerini TaxID=55779 RepID=A0A6I5ZNV7_9FIRM|nr:ABC transporter permease [Moorella glycerini]QGP91269.1 Ribose import permease protein RbsC [Moorella glycerini]
MLMTKKSTGATPVGRATKINFQELGILLVLVVICLILSVLTSNFREPTNLINVVRQFSEISIMAIGMTFVIISAEIDLSVGSIYGLAAIIAGYLLHNGYAATLAFLLAMLTGVGLGFINGIISTKGKIPSFIVTLSMLQLARGGAYAISHGWPISEFPDTHNWVFFLGQSLGGVIPVQIIIMLLLNLLAFIVLSRTTFGFKVYAVGGNKNAARLAGINVDGIKIASFVLAGAMAALAGIIGLAHLNSVAATAGAGREMDVIAAVIIGGTNLFGGKGTILGTLLGAAIMGVVRNGMVLLGVEAYYQEAFIGVVILIAVLADTWLTKNKK